MGNDSLGQEEKKDEKENKSNDFLDQVIKKSKELFYKKSCPIKELIDNDSFLINKSKDYSDLCQGYLERIHNPNSKKTTCNYMNHEQSYQCPRSIFVYTCKYANKYASENYTLLEKILQELTVASPKILSFGAGPATELFALNQLVNEKIINSYLYAGIDNNENWIELWEYIADSHKNENEKIYFYLSDATAFVKNCNISNFDIILFNYMISDYAKFASKKVVINFLNLLKQKLLNSNAVIAYNDINLNYPGDLNMGATHLLNDVFAPEYQIICQAYKNNKPGATFVHKDFDCPIIKKNDLIFKCSQDTEDFNPYESMAAIQIILKKR